LTLPVTRLTTRHRRLPNSSHKTSHEIQKITSFKSQDKSPDRRLHNAKTGHGTQKITRFEVRNQGPQTYVSHVLDSHVLGKIKVPEGRAWPIGIGIKGASPGEYGLWKV